MTSSGIVTLIGALIASITVTSAAVMTYKREKFEQDRILKLDEERAERNRLLIASMDTPRLGLTTPPDPRYIQMAYNPSTNSYSATGIEQRPQQQIPVNWSETPSAPRLALPNSYGYGYGSANTNTGGNQLTWNNNDSIISAIASRPPTASPIFGVRR